MPFGNDVFASYLFFLLPMVLLFDQLAQDTRDDRDGRC